MMRYALLLEDQGARGNKTSVTDRMRDELIEATCDRAFFLGAGAANLGSAKTVSANAGPAAAGQIDVMPVRDRKAFEARVAKAKVRLVACALSGVAHEAERPAFCCVAALARRNPQPPRHFALRAVCCHDAVRTLAALSTLSAGSERAS